MASRPFFPSRRYGSLPRRSDGNHNENRRQMRRGIADERGRKRSRPGSHDRTGALRSQDPSADERMSGRDRSESQTLASSQEPPPSPHSPVVRGKGKAVDLGKVANGLGSFTSGSEAERVAIDKSVRDARIHGFPNAEHTVIGDSKRGNRDRAPKALTLRQSVRAHLSLPETEPLKVSGPPHEPENRTPGPGLRHGRPSLLERISGMEGSLSSQPVPVSALHLDISASPHPHPSLRQAVIRPRQSAEASGNINSTEEGTIDIDNQLPDHISNITHDNDVTAHVGRPDRTPRVDTDEERTHGGLAEIRSVMVVGISPTVPTSTPLPLVPSTPAEPRKTTAPSPVIVNPRNKLLERLDGERKRAIGAASGELEVEPVAGNMSEGSLRAELRARNRLRARLVVAKGDGHVNILEP
jgi:hypothetical protein